MKHQVGFRTEIGRTHRVNQDSGGAWTLVRPTGVPASLLVVADGVSSGQHSEEASKLAVRTLYDRVIGNLAGEEGVDSLLERLHAAALDVNHQVAIRPHLNAVTADATTLTALVAVGDQAAGLWCGDSRIYKLSRTAERLTRDHSWAEGVVRHGLMTAEQAGADPRAHMITRWIGPPDGEDPGIERFQVTMTWGDAVMCCSDGLYGYFAPPFASDDDMAEVLDGSDIQAGIDSLVTLARERGGHDDITAAAIRLVAG